ncbi:cobalamin biosynthesis protein CobW [Methylobacterium sp. 174MFSha1.1]|uniref:CobW family GTP-binding protein n=1 Tax=Methylobacterium sp. 174MFSha1.1 TaxID=1502749 RepID=UPI0008EB04EF|nr:GTP-binding protein [Methylobacterium sp. 174MFSha1.1]SFU46170.1 cobalamin biosynthesis protein CobW [Methylobacterium sp. 174MFSha1.1]
MSVPVVLVAGFLGAGKTTLVNGLLREPGGRRIAALVNDFGAIDVDADLLGLATDGVVSLRNGCICCSLQGDLMRSLATLLRRNPAPDAIVIETSGAADPAEIVRALLDPAVFAATPLDTVVTVVDARHLADRPSLLDDSLWRAQVAAADLCVVAKTDLVEETDLAGVRAGLARHKPARLTFAAGTVPAANLLFSGEDRPSRRESASAEARGTARLVAAECFDTLSWTARHPLALARFQAAIGRLAPHLVRAKGFVSFAHQPDRPMLFQLVGTRATVVPTAVPARDGVAARLVLIARSGDLDRDRATALLDAAVEPGGPG